MAEELYSNFRGQLGQDVWAWGVIAGLARACAAGGRTYARAWSIADETGLVDELALLAVEGQAIRVAVWIKGVREGVRLCLALAGRRGESVPDARKEGFDGLGRGAVGTGDVESKGGEGGVEGVEALVALGG